MSLMYLAGQDIPTSREGLIHIPTPAGMGARHNPYPFGQYVEDIHHALDMNGIAVANEEYVVGHEGQRLFGMMELAPKPLEGELITAKDWNLTLGLRGSHDQSIARGLVLGSQTIVCSNLMFDGDLGKFVTMQTTNIGSRLPSLIRGAVARIPEVARRTEQRYDIYKNFEMRQRWGDAALVEIHRRGGLSGAQLSRAISEWDRPSHEEHAEHGFSAWRLMQACTESLKPTGQTVNMNIVQDRSERVSSFIDEITEMDRMLGAAA